MGILDPEFWKSPAGIGLLSGVASYMAGAQGGRPVNSIGRGLAGGLIGYNAAQDNIRQDQENAFKQKFQTMLMADMQNKIDAYNQGQQWRAGLPAAMAKTKDVQSPYEADNPFNEDLGNLQTVTQVPDMEARREYLMRPGSPHADKLIEQQLFPKDQEWDTTPRYDQQGRAFVTSKTGQIKYLEGVAERVDPNKPFRYGPNGEIIPNEAYQNYEYTKAAKGAPKNTQIVGPTTVMAGEAAEKAGGKFGTDVGAQLAGIEGKYTALDSVRDAKEMLDQGIYSGYWAKAGMTAAKATSGAIGSREKAANTEAFLSYVGNTVVPRLQEFGGNDSVEEMKYLQGIMGGNITFEPEAIKKVLDSAERKIQRGIERLQRQQSALEQGQMPKADPGPSRLPPPKPGMVKNGYRFIGGDPANPKSWVKVN